MQTALNNYNLIRNYINNNYKDIFNELFKYNKELNSWISTNQVYLYIHNNSVYEDIQDLSLYNDYIEIKTKNYLKALKEFKEILEENNLIAEE